MISDLNNDGNMDVLIFTSLTLLKLVTISSAKNPYKPPEEKHTLVEEVRTGDMLVSYLVVVKGECLISNIFGSHT